MRIFDYLFLPPPSFIVVFLTQQRKRTLYRQTWFKHNTDMIKPA